MSYRKAILTELLKKTPKIGSGQTFFGMTKNRAQINVSTWSLVYGGNVLIQIKFRRFTFFLVYFFGTDRMIISNRETAMRNSVALFG